jgi:hypothetical protein
LSIGAVVALTVWGVLAARFARFHVAFGAVLWSFGCVVCIGASNPRLAPRDSFTFWGVWMLAASVGVYFHLNAIRAANRLWGLLGLVVWAVVLVLPFVAYGWLWLPEFMFLSPIWLFGIAVVVQLPPPRTQTPSTTVTAV